MSMEHAAQKAVTRIGADAPVGLVIFGHENRDQSTMLTRDACSRDGTTRGRMQPLDARIRAACPSTIILGNFTTTVSGIRIDVKPRERGKEKQSRSNTASLCNTRRPRENKKNRWLGLWLVTPVPASSSTFEFSIETTIKGGRAERSTGWCNAYAIYVVEHTMGEPTATTSGTIESRTASYNLFANNGVGKWYRWYIRVSQAVVGMRLIRTWLNVGICFCSVGRRYLSVGICRLPASDGRALFSVFSKLDKHVLRESELTEEKSEISSLYIVVVRHSCLPHRTSTYNLQVRIATKYETRNQPRILSECLSPNTKDSTLW
ncbi:hypothetical protein U1Q18_052234 [Sarracenia purpurea var. burkii]